MLSYKVLPGERKVVYKHINAKGTIYFQIINKSGTNALDMWWTVGPFSSNKRLGIKKGTGSIKIVGIGWGRLKVGSADSETIINLTDKPEVAQNFPTIRF